MDSYEEYKRFPGLILTMIATAALSFCNTDELNLPNKLYEDLKVHLTLSSLSLIACPLGNFPRKSAFKTAMFSFANWGFRH